MSIAGVWLATIAGVMVLLGLSWPQVWLATIAGVVVLLGSKLATGLAGHYSWGYGIAGF